MRFEWDEAKNLRNQAKHGFSFETAVLVFRDSRLLTESARPDAKTGEPRWLAIGSVADLPAPIVAVYTDRTKSNDEEKNYRIISARKARNSERRRYLQQAPE